MGSHELALELQEIKERIEEISYEMVECDEVEELEQELGLLEERANEIEALLDSFGEMYA